MRIIYLESYNISHKRNWFVPQLLICPLILSKRQWITLTDIISVIFPLLSLKTSHPWTDSLLCHSCFRMVCSLTRSRVINWWNTGEWGTFNGLWFIYLWTVHKTDKLQYMPSVSFLQSFSVVRIRLLHWSLLVRDWETNWKTFPSIITWKNIVFLNRENDTDVESWFTHSSLQQNCVRWHRGGLLAALQVRFFGGSSYSSVVFMQEVTNLSD